MSGQPAAIRLIGRLLCSVCLLVMLFAVAWAPPPPSAADDCQLAHWSANVAPVAVDFSDTALQLSGQWLSLTQWQAKSLARPAVLPALGFSRPVRHPSRGIFALPELPSLMALGIALRL